MKILMWSVGPIFQNAVHGGSQKILRDVARYLGETGTSVRILCVRRPDNQEPFELSPNVQVLPVLRLKPTYPEPYYTAPHNIGDLILTLRRHLDWCDTFYVHDAELPFHFTYHDRPTVFSFRDFVYADTLVGAFGFQRDRLILSSEYLARCVLAAFRPFRPSLAERICIVRNGVDLGHFAPFAGDATRQLGAILGNAPAKTFTLLYPHRPDSRKGMFDAVRITAELAQRLSRRGSSVRLLIPVWMDSQLDTPSDHEYQQIYGQVLKMAETLAIRDSVHLHPWVPHALMPEYLSAGDVTLSVGNFVEAFGNVHLESVACGTPCIVARVAAHAYSLPDTLVHRIPHGDISAAVDRIEDCLVTRYDVDAAREFLRDNYSFTSMIEGYERALRTATPSEPLRFEPLPPLEASSSVCLAPWCRNDGLGIYNDYSYSRLSEGRPIALAEAAAAPTPLSRLVAGGFSIAEVEDEIRNGLLVRVPGPGSPG